MNDEELCDEEKSYHKWVADNLEYLAQNRQHVIVMKKVYMEGFAAGFQHYKVCRAEEQLQK